MTKYEEITEEMLELVDLLSTQIDSEHFDAGAQTCNEITELLTFRKLHEGLEVAQ